MKIVALTILFLTVVTLLFPEFSHACPNCKEAYASDGVTPVASGFGASILFLMSMPFLVVAAFALRLWSAQRRLRTNEMQG